MSATDLQQQRIEILHQIDDISQNCIGCENYRNRDTNKYCTKQCLVGAELQSLGDELLNCKSNSKTNLILAKGDEMTKSEVTYLVKLGVPKGHIQKAIGISNRAFNETLRAWGLLASKKKVTA